jgi:hypothetical protein
MLLASQSAIEKGSVKKSLSTCGMDEHSRDQWNSSSNEIDPIYRDYERIANRTWIELSSPWWSTTTPVDCRAADLGILYHAKFLRADDLVNPQFWRYTWTRTNLLTEPSDVQHSNVLSSID